MQHQSFFTRTSLTVVFPALLILIISVGYALNLNAVRQPTIISIRPAEAIAATPSPVIQTVGLPSKLRIPAIKVDSPIVNVGLTSGGAMAMRENWDEAMWYQPGRRPGEVGSAVIAGHYVRGATAVFNELYKLQKGDKIYIDDIDGSVIKFVVRDKRSFAPDADTSGIFGSSDGKSHLNLITCEGVWDDNSGSYSKRLVVFADKE